MVLATPIGLQIEPESFDFGWCPENAQVSAQFKLKNVTSEIIPVTEVRPSCGCTAADFTPADLSSSDVMEVGLTFNTRGYNGRPFNKQSEIKTTTSNEVYLVWLKGHVSNSTAAIYPEGTGVAEFLPGATEDQQSLTLRNKGTKDVTLKVVQEPAKWVKYKLSEKSIPAGQAVTLKVSVKPPYEETKVTSMTFEATEDPANKNRFTVAVRTGLSQDTPRKIKSPEQQN